MSNNPEVLMTLDDAVEEVLGMLTGLDLTYDSSMDRYRSIARQLNRALRSMALEKEWSWYHSTRSLGEVVAGERMVYIPNLLRPRIVNDDAVRLVDPDSQRPVRWAYFLPRDALHKYDARDGLWASVTRNDLEFSRPFDISEEGLEIHLPVMREPTMFRLPEPQYDQDVAIPPVPEEVRQQPVDFQYPDVVILRAAFYYAQTDPVMQPRVQTLEAQYKDIMYQIIERDDRNTDSPELNQFRVPIDAGIHEGGPRYHRHPHSDAGRF